MIMVADDRRLCYESPFIRIFKNMVNPTHHVHIVARDATASTVQSARKTRDT